MCLPMLCYGCVGWIPYVWLLTMPLYGSFCGTEPVLRMSLLMCFMTVLGWCTPNALKSIVPCLQLAVLVGLVSLPVTTIPYPVVWVYDKALWMSEPMWLILEVTEVLTGVMALSQTLVNKMEDEDSGLIKSVILSVSGISYVLSALICISLFGSDSLLSKWLALILILMTVVVHIAMYMADDGIISDAAGVTLLGFCVLFAMRSEVYDLQNPYTPPDSWNSTDNSISFLQLLFSLSKSSVDNAHKAVRFLKKMVSPTFLVLAAVRLYSVVAGLDLFSQWQASEKEDDNDDDDILDLSEEDANDFQTSKLSSLWSSPLVIQLVILFVYTQLVSYHIQQWSTVTKWLPSFFYIWRDIVPGRVMQIVLLYGLYFYRLCWPDKDDW